MLTDFDKLVNNSNNQDQEKKPFVLSRLHGIPKQIADSSNSIGVNEKTLKNGLMSGVIQPSQIAHDRWLSIFDGLMDVLMFFIFTLIVSLIGVDIYSISILIGMYVYMFFHLMWWEHAMQWYFIETIIDYLNKTRKFYYATLIIGSVLIPTFGFHYVMENNINDEILQLKDKLISLNNTMNLSSKINSVNLPKNSPFAKNTDEFATKRPMVENPKKDSISDNNKNDEVSNNKNDEVIEVFSLFLFLSLVHVVVLFIMFKLTNKMYYNIRIKNLNDVDTELKSELELKMFMLRDK